MLHPNARDITGVRFGKLVAKEPTGERRDGKLVWRCECDCGGVRETTQASLASGHAQSCGCALSEAARRLKIRARYGRWTVVGYAGKSYWRCRCDCGREADVLASNLRQNGSRSCGCLRDEMLRTHGMSKHPLYKRWHAMLERCRNPKRNGYENYGGRGIKVCPEWNDFATFLADVGAPPSPRHSLDRVDTNGNYEPANVRWATWGEQARNKRRTKEVALEQASVGELRAALARALAHSAPKSGAQHDPT
jgi:hypothetical protein